MPSINDPARQQLQLFSARLGQIAGGLPATRSVLPPAPGPVASPLAAILAQLGRHRTAQKDVAHTLKAHEFIMSD